MIDSIYFSQHGLAVDKADNAERPLSQAGIQQTRAIAKILHDSKTPIAGIFHSGKLRAAQTAEIFANAVDIDLISEVDGLSPNDDVELLAKNMNINHALYVGHLPHLEKLAAYLITGKEDGNIIKFQNSAVACLEKSKGDFQLRWHLTPELTGEQI